MKETFALPSQLTYAVSREYLRTLEQKISEQAKKHNASNASTGDKGADTGADNAAPSAMALFTLDASRVRDFDSSALSVLLGAKRAAFNVKLELNVVGMPKKLERLASAYGLAEIL